MMDQSYLMYVGIFATSVIYAVILQWWWRKDPDTFEENTWFLVVIGVAYVMLWLRPIIPNDAWDAVFFGFVVACGPIIGRSLYNNAVRSRNFRRWLATFRRSDR